MKQTLVFIKQKCPMKQTDTCAYKTKVSNETDMWTLVLIKQVSNERYLRTLVLIKQKFPMKLT